jgi:polysaccharide biosynthesis transport protein
MNRITSEDAFASRVNVSPRPAQAQSQPIAPMMNAHSMSIEPRGLNQGDIYYILFRHKWKILLCALAGLVGAAAVYRFMAPPFQSEAKLFVRYIISAERKALGPGTHENAAKSPDERGETIMKSEAEILSSLDLAKQVAETIGTEKLLAGGRRGNDLNAAIGLIKTNLTVNVTPGSSVIHVLFRHSDPEIVQPVLREVIDRYFKLHVETHTANGMLGDFLTQETDQLRSRLAQTEEDLRKAIGKAGIISLEDAKKTNSDQLAAIRRELFNAQAELAQRTAVLEELKRRFPTNSAADESDATVPANILAEHQGATQQVQHLQQQERELLTQFTPGNARVQEIRALLATAVEARNALEKQNPKLTQISPSSRTGDAAPIDTVAVATQITALEAKIKVLTRQLEDVRGDATKVDQMEGTIIDLRRKKELEEANYRYYAESAEQSRINETLGNGRVSNIIRIQTPSPPFSDRGQTNKIAGLLLGGGLFIGIAWAFLIELYLDRSIKRAVDIERTLHVPLFLSIPALRRKELKELKAAPLMLNAPNGTNGKNGHTASDSATNGAHGTNGHQGTNSHSVAPADSLAHPLQVFHETLRDRLIGYFESINLTHKPKLVAVTSLGRNAGVTTTAAGLARSLSETGEGNVLLVDMNVGQGVAQQFMKGKAVCGLDELLDARQNAHVDENLYVVAESNNSDRLSRNMPQRFSKLVPKLKASDFDYIIFDMPPVSQISITPRLAGFMDMVLMVVESEKTDRDLVQRATALLGESRAHVGVVLNKMKRYVPRRLYQDSLANN